MPVTSEPWPARLFQVSTYNVPLTTVPNAATGFTVTEMVAVAPAGMNTAVPALPPVDRAQKSPVDELTAGSNGLAVAVIEMVAVPGCASVANGPISSTSVPHEPNAT